MSDHLRDRKVRRELRLKRRIFSAAGWWRPLLFWITVWPLMLAACNPPTPEPTPIQPLERLLVTTSLAPRLAQSLAEYHATLTHPEIRLEVMPVEQALQAVGAGEADLAVIGQAPPEDWFATPLGAEPLAIVVHPDNPVRDVDPMTLARLFSGRQEIWGQGSFADERVQPIVPLQNDESWVVFTQLILLNSNPSPGSLLAPSPLAVLELVAERPGALGIAPLTGLEDQVRTLRLNGVAPSEQAWTQGDYALGLPINATAPDEPSGALRRWLGWMQRRD